LKRFGFLSFFLVFLAFSAWGDNYFWIGGGGDDDWTNPDNWSGGTPLTYPGENNTNDTATINGAFTVTVDTAINYPPDSLTLQGSAVLTTNGNLTTTDLTIADTATLTGNITLDGGGGTLSIAGNTVSIAGTSGTIGTLSLGGRAVSITTDTGNTAVAIGTITTTGTKSLEVSGTRNLDGGNNSFASVTVSAGTLTLVGDITSAATIINGNSLTSSSGTVDLGTVTMTTGTLSLRGTETIANTGLTGTVEFTGNGAALSGITSFNNLTIQGGARTGVGAITVGGKFELNGGSLSATSLTVTGTSAISGNVTTTTGNTHSYGGTVTLGTPVTSPIILTGTTVTFLNTVGGAYPLTITGSAVFNNSVNIGSLTVSVNSSIEADITTSGTQQYATVGLDGSGLHTLTGNTVTITGTVTGNNNSLRIAGDAVLSTVIASTDNLTALTVTGTATINANITTSVTQQYWAVILGGTRTLTGTTVTIGDEVTGNNYSLTIDGIAYLNTVNTLAGLTVNNGTATLYADITTSGNQTYNGAVTLGGTGARTLKTTAGYISIDGIASAPNGVTIDASGVITIESGGITASTGSAGVIRLESGNNIVINGNINGYQLLAIATGHTVTIGSSATIHTSSNGNEGTAASIYVVADTFVVNNTTANSIEPGLPASTGRLCLNLADPWTDTNNVVQGSRWHQHFPIKNNLVYSTATGPYTDGTGATISNYTHINPTDPSIIDDEFSVPTGFNIYIIDAGTISKALTFTVSGGNGVIEIQDSYKSSSNLTLNPGTGGIRLVDADIDLSNGNFINTSNAAVTLRGSNGNSIKAANITLGAVSGTGDFTLNATNNISMGQVGTNGARIGDLTISGDAAVTLSGSVYAANVTTSTGQVSITGNATIDVTGAIKTGSGGINGMGNLTFVGNISAPNGVTIEANGDITIGNGGINSNPVTTTGVITLKSNDNITINSPIYGSQVLITAINTVTVNGSLESSSTNDLHHGTHTMYIEADTLSLGSITIKTGPTADLCLEVENIDDPNNILDNVVVLYHNHKNIIPGVKILYSFTEDKDGNGKLDRIRVQTNVALNGNFVGFTVDVTGYQIDTSKGTTGFEQVSPVSPNNDSFYIWLKEKSELDFDGGSTPTWRITNGGSLRNSTGNSYLETGSIGTFFTPVDTIPPRIAYTLTLPGHPQTYVRMSEPVEGGASFNFGGGITHTVNQIDSFSYLLNLSDSFNIGTLEGLAFTGTLADGFFSVTAMKDRSKAPATIGGVAPKYPANWGYTSYLPNNTYAPPYNLINHYPTTSISGIAVNAAVNLIRRVTDVLISVPPSAVETDDRYFAWPLWANSDKNNRIISVFDGTKSVEEGIINLEAIRGSGLTPALQILWKASPGASPLWQPFSALYYFAPVPAPPPSTLNANAPPPNPPLYNFQFSNIANGNRIEFYFLLGSQVTNGQFVARLAAPVGSIPSDWYNRVRPFGFRVGAAGTQRGGASILNNVINSNAREKTIIRYNLVRPGRVTIQVFTLEGTLVKSLRRNEHRAAGEYTDDEWDGSNNAGRPVARGMYFIRIVGPDIDEIRKVMVIK